MPSDAGFGKLRNQFRVFGREVLGFTLIPVHVKEFGMVLHTPPAPRLRLLLVGGVSFQFFTRLAAVFAEEVGGFGFIGHI